MGASRILHECIMHSSQDLVVPYARKASTQLSGKAVQHLSDDVVDCGGITCNRSFMKIKEDSDAFGPESRSRFT